jgi:hypothetical protein
MSECPVCEMKLPSNMKHREANEAHIAACIASRLNNNLSLNDSQPQQSSDDDECPICHTSFSSMQMRKNEQDREAHVAACIERATASSATENKVRDYSEKSDTPKSISSKQSSDEKWQWKRKQDSMAQPMPSAGVLSTQQRPSLASTAGGRQPSGLKSFLSKFGPNSQTGEEKTQSNMAKADELMTERWGPPGSPVRELVLRYWIATRMREHWEYLREGHPRQFRKHLDYGYMEPIPTQWVRDRRLACLYPEFSLFETPAEERLYYLLNNGVMPDGSKHPPLRPLNVNRDMRLIIRRGNERNARQVRLNPQQLAEYRSMGDVFRSDRQIKSYEYSYQVPNIVYQARSAALHQLADGILHGTDHLETMVLIDVSGSMTWNPHGGMVGPDGVRRFHDQPPNIFLVEHLVHRVLHHMIPRAKREHPHQTGIDTCIFSSTGLYVGQLTASHFLKDWNTKIRRNLGGGTQVMQGWQMVKQTYFEHQHRTYGHGRFDPVYGWQPTPGMPKLSLLVFLDGEAQDMDEFELELLGEKWAYVTIALVGMENCPHHHSHAIELERVAKFNPHIGFFDVHGRVCERMVVEDLLGSVYPVDPPKYEEILKPEYDLKQDEELPAYVA